MKAVKLAVRALAILFLLTVVGHWLGWLWLSRVAAVGMAAVLVMAGLVAAWTGWGDPPESVGLSTWTMVQPPPPAHPSTDAEPQTYQDPDR